jgi:TRAP-type C4-dicarboxylate transport system permease small subunit
MFHLGEISYAWSRWFDWIARGAMVAMMLLSVANILCGYVWHPILGTYELVSFLTIVALSFAIPYCAVRKGHVAVSFVMDILPERVQKVFDVINGVLSVGIFGLLSWQSAVYATKLWHKGEVSGTLHLPLHPLVYGISLGCLLLTLVLLAELIELLAGRPEK